MTEVQNGSIAAPDTAPDLRPGEPAAAPGDFRTSPSDEVTHPRMSRRALRESVFKLLFMSEFNDTAEMEEQLRVYYEGVGSDLLAQMKTDAPDEADAAYIQEKYAHIREKCEEIDRLLNDVSEGWKTSRMNRVDLSILRLAVYEIRYDPEIPVRVAINEAVEIAKQFGGADSGSFVNGILGKIAGKQKEKTEE